MHNHLYRARLRRRKAAARTAIVPRSSDVVDLTDLLFPGDPVDTERLLAELAVAEAAHGFTAKAFSGWTSIPLRSLRGMLGQEGSAATGEHLSTDPHAFRDTAIMQPYTREVVSRAATCGTTPCPLLKVRLMRLEPLSQIGEHRDAFVGDGYVFRLHIPLRTNPEVTFTVNGRGYHMAPGRVYSVDVTQLHSVANASRTEDRVHLVFDVLASPAYRRLVASAAR